MMVVMMVMMMMVLVIGGDVGVGDEDEMRGEKEGEDMVGVARLPKGDVGTCSYKAPMIMVMMMVMMVMMIMIV